MTLFYAVVTIGKMAWTPGTRIGSYEIVDVLGHGGMGEVFRVRHLISDRIEAIKILLSASSTSTEMLDRFTREIRLLATLNHPNIAALHTAFHHDNQLVMVMEYVEGADLGRRLGAGVTLKQAMEYARQVLTALEYAHARGIIHRDIKPSNIMITPDERVKLLDFGLALGSPDSRLTTTGALVGSMHYIAPEQISGEPHDARSDMYAVGVTLYEMITGRLPIEGGTYPQVIAAHLQHRPVSPATLNAGVPEALSSVVMKALAKDTRERWQTAAEFLGALNAIQIDDALEGRVVWKESSGKQESKRVYQPEQLNDITRKLASHVGPIASILVKRASSSCSNLQELCDQVASEIESADERQRFIASVRSYRQGSNWN
jgi:eukaryotic-like serine/threonine-protein kinase